MTHSSDDELTPLSPDDENKKVGETFSLRKKTRPALKKLAAQLNLKNDHDLADYLLTIGIQGILDGTIQVPIKTERTLDLP